MPPRGFWLINGLPPMRSRSVEGDQWKVKGELLDVPARVQAMQDMVVDTQVIYSTMFSAGGIGSTDVELALLRSWLADKTAVSGGKPRWIMLPAAAESRCHVTGSRISRCASFSCRR